MKKLIVIIIVICLSGCYGRTKALTFKKNNINVKHKKMFCLNISPNISKVGNIYSTTYLKNKNKLASFNYSYTLDNIFNNISISKKKCGNTNEIILKDIFIFRKTASDTSQWKNYFFIELIIDYVSDSFELKNVSFKDFDNTGWVYVFWFHKPESEIVTETIQRALLRIFADIEDTIENQLTLEQRNSKKSKDRLETEELMDKYIKLQKELE